MEKVVNVDQKIISRTEKIMIRLLKRKRENNKMKKHGYRKLPLLEIIWKDHSADSGWVEPEDLEEPSIVVRTIGWLIKEDDDRYFLVTSLTSDKGMGGLNEILKPTVIKTKVLRKTY